MLVCEVEEDGEKKVFVGIPRENFDGFMETIDDRNYACSISIPLHLLKNHGIDLSQKNTIEISTIGKVGSIIAALTEEKDIYEDFLKYREEKKKKKGKVVKFPNLEV